MKKLRNDIGGLGNSLRICCIVTTVMFCFIAGVKAESRQVSETWEMQYQEFKKGIEACKKNQRASSPHIFDRQSLVLPEDLLPAGIVIRRTTALLNHMRTLHGAPDLKDIGSRLNKLRKQYSQNRTESKALYLEACKVRWDLCLSHPLLDFDEMILVTSSCCGNDFV